MMGNPERRLVGMAVVVVLHAGTAIGTGSVGPAFASDTTDIGIIALLPTSVPSRVPNGATGQRVLDSLIAAELNAAGYAIVPVEVVRPVWGRIVDSVRGFYDPASGEVIPEKLAAVRGAVAREVGAGALLEGRVAMIRLPFKGSKKVEYDGVSEKVTPAGDMSGEVSAISLVVVVSDTSGTALHCGRGGIQLLAKGTLWSTRVREVKPEKVFAESDRNLAAVRRALGGLLDRQPTCVP